MKITTIFLGSALVASSLFAADNLAKAAKDAGLVALPTNQAALAKLAEETAIDAKDFPSTPERVELGKNLPAWQYYCLEPAVRYIDDVQPLKSLTLPLRR